MSIPLKRIENLTNPDHSLREIVQSEIFGVSVTKESTESWLKGLIQATQQAIEEFTIQEHGIHENTANWSRLYNYLMACGLSIRYASDKATCLHYLPELMHCFHSVLKLKSWTPQLTPLKILCLQGFTRMEECFVDDFHVADEIVGPVMVEFYSEIEKKAAEEDVQGVLLLLRPTSEYLRVIIQTSPNQFAQIIQQTLALQLRLFRFSFRQPATTENSLEYKDLINEQLEVVAIVFESVVSPIPDTLQLLGIPNWVRHDSVSLCESTSPPLVSLYNILSKKELEEPAEEPNEMLYEACMQCLQLLETSSNSQLNVPPLLSLFCRVATTSFSIQCQNKIVKATSKALLTSIRNLTYSSTLDMEYVLVIVECFTEMVLVIPETTLEPFCVVQVFDEFNQLLLKLKSVLRQPHFLQGEIKSIARSHCSSIRESLVQFFISIFHRYPKTIFPHLDSFMKQSFPLLADPLILGDLVHLLVLVDKEEDKEISSNTNTKDDLELKKENNNLLLVSLIQTIEKSLGNLKLYSKSASVKIIQAVGRIAFSLSSCTSTLWMYAPKWLHCLLDQFEQRADVLGKDILESIGLIVFSLNGKFSCSHNQPSEKLWQKQEFQDGFQLLQNCIIGKYPKCLEKLSSWNHQETDIDLTSIDTTLEMDLVLEALHLVSLLIQDSCFVNIFVTSLKQILRCLAIEIVKPPFYDDDVHLILKKLDFFHTVLLSLMKNNHFLATTTVISEALPEDPPADPPAAPETTETLVISSPRTDKIIDTKGDNVQEMANESMELSSFLTSLLQVKKNHTDEMILSSCEKGWKQLENFCPSAKTLEMSIFQ